MIEVSRNFVKMNRGDGLVQRRNVSKETTDSSQKDGEDGDKKLDHDEEAGDGDSKETRLTLMEEVLLLGLKDKEVREALAAEGAR